MTRQFLVTLATLIFFILPQQVHAEVTFRDLYTEHYHGGQCCYCGVADSVQDIDGESLRVTIGGKTYTVPKTILRSPAPERPNFKGYILCDSEQKIWDCLIVPDAGI